MTLLQHHCTTINLIYLTYYTTLRLPVYDATQHTRSRTYTHARAKKAASFPLPPRLPHQQQQQQQQQQYHDHNCINHTHNHSVTHSPGGGCSSLLHAGSASAAGGGLCRHGVHQLAGAGAQEEGESVFEVDSSRVKYGRGT